MTTNTTTQGRARPRRFLRRAILIATGLIVLVSALPTLLSMTMASRFLEGAIRDRMRGEVAVSSVSLGWFSSQRVTGLVIDGGEDTGSVTLTAEVDEGLLALVMGSDLRVKVGGSVMSVTSLDGSANILKLFKSESSDEAPLSSSPTTRQTAAVAAPFFGSRKVGIAFDEFVLGSHDHASSASSLVSLSGTAALQGADALLDVHGIVTSKQGTTTNAGGTIACRGIVHVATDAHGEIDLVASTLDLTISVKDGRLSLSDGLMEKVSLDLHASKDAEGTISLDGTGSGVIAGHAPSTFSMKVRTPQFINAQARVQFDPATTIAHVDLRSFPIAPLTPLLRAAGLQSQIDPILDIGATADVVVQSAGAGALIVSLDTQRVKLRFEGVLASDGESLRDGAFDASIFVRPEVVSALVGADATAPLVATIAGDSIEWSKALASSGSFTEAIGGDFTLALERRTAMMLPESLLASVLDGLEPTQVELSTCSVRASKSAGDARLALASTAQVAIGKGSAQSLDFKGSIDLGTQAVTIERAALSGAIDPTLLASLTGGALAVGPRGASLKASIAQFKFDPAATPFEHGGTLRVEVGGSIILEGAQAQAAVTDLAVKLDLPSGGIEGSVVLQASIDGATTRVTQLFTALPRSIEQLSQVGLRGSVNVAGLDPRLLSHLAPATTQYLGFLGRDGVALTVHNTSKDGTLRAKYAVDGKLAQSSGTLLLGRDSITLEGMETHATLTAESLASLPIPEGMLIEPGAQVSLRSPMVSVRKTVTGWELPDRLAATIALKSVRLLRASFLAAPLGLASLEAKLSYAMSSQRATAEGTAMLGGGGTAGSMQFQLAWSKPTAAALLGGVSGEVTLKNFDFARFEPCFGIAPGAYSELLGGSGACTARFSEAPMVVANASLDFPSVRGTTTMSLSGDGKTRAATGTASLSAVLSKELLGKLAGIERDASRRVLQPVTLACAIDAFTLPLHETFAPNFANASFAARGSLSPVVMEVTRGQGPSGARSTLSTGTLALTSSCTRLGEQLALRLESDASDLAQGSLSVDAKARGLLSASPIVDAEIRAKKFPAATIDVLAGTGGAVQKYVGDAVDAELVAKGLAKDRGLASASIRGAQATLEAPQLLFSEAFLKIAEESPLRVTCAMSGAVKEELLAAINPVFSDIVTAKPVVFTVTSLAWPTDGDRRKFDAAFDLTLGEVRLTNSGVLAFLLSSGGTDAVVEPLHGSITDGRLTYDNFNLRFGKMSNAQWKNSLTFAGDVDLVRLYANSISTEVPLSDATHWSSKADLFVQGLGARGQEFIRSLKVGVKLSGPMFDASGKPAKLQVTPTFPDIGKSMLENPGELIDIGKSIYDAFKK